MPLSGLCTHRTENVRAAESAGLAMLVGNNTELDSGSACAICHDTVTCQGTHALSVLHFSAFIIRNYVPCSTESHIMFIAEGILCIENLIFPIHRCSPHVTK